MSILLDGLNGITSPAGTVVSLTTTGNTIIGDATTDTLNVGAGGLVKDASGNVGIGTASPNALLHVSAAIAKIRIGETALSAYLDISRDSATGYSIYNAAQAVPFRAHIWQLGGTETMRIDSSGNLLVGTTSQIGSGVINIGTYKNGSAVAGFATKPSTNANYDAAVFYNSSGTYVGYIGCTATTTTYATSSDYRLKNTIAPMTGALDKVLQLKPVTYKWKSTGEESQGFIAHELQAVVPDCVTGKKDAVDAEGNPVHQGIDTSFLVATLTAAIQELKEIVDAQAVRIAALEA
jgi:hypothetical protein